MAEPVYTIGCLVILLCLEMLVDVSQIAERVDIFLLRREKPQ